MTDDIDRSWDWYNDALKGKRGQIDADNPRAGYYRSKAKDKSLSPVAYWYDSNDGSLRCHQNGRDVPDMRAREMWPFVSKNPIPEDVYYAFLETGKWTDIDAAAQPLKEAVPGTPVTPELLLKTDIDAAKASAVKYAKVESDEEMTLAQSLRAKLQELASKADKLRVEEKEPHLAASRDADAKWQPMIKEAKAAADGVRKAMEAWNDFKLEQSRKAKAEADRLAREAIEKGKPAPAPVVSNAPAPSVQVTGGGGRAAHVGIKNVVTGFDLDLAFQHFRLDREVSDVLFKLAQSAIDAGITVPGVTVEQKSNIR